MGCLLAAIAVLGRCLAALAFGLGGADAAVLRLTAAGGWASLGHGGGGDF